MVRIRDARLGVLHYSSMCLIVIYIVVYKLIALGGYLTFTSPINTVRLTLQQPTVGGCNPNHPTCKDNFVKPSALDYCWLPSRTEYPILDKPGYKFNTSNCSYMDGTGASIVHANSIMVATSLHEYSQARSPGCAIGSDACEKVWEIHNDTVTYIVDPENFTVLVDSNLIEPDVSGSKAPQGFLYVSKSSDETASKIQDKLCADEPSLDAIWGGSDTSTAPCYISPWIAKGKDIYKIGTLLRSMGLSLNDAIEPTKPNKGTKRSEGMLVSMETEYTNFHMFSLGAESRTRYAYKLSEIPSSGYKEAKMSFTEFPQKRVKQDLHGVLFIVQATGSLATFNMTSMLIQLTTSLALIAVSTTITNMLAQYVLTLSPFYLRAMYQNTHDFSDLRCANDLTDEALIAALVSKGLKVEGTRLDQIHRLLDQGWQPQSTPATSFMSATGGDLTGGDLTGSSLQQVPLDQSLQQRMLRANGLA